MQSSAPNTQKLMRPGDRYKRIAYAKSKIEQYWYIYNNNIPTDRWA